MTREYAKTSTICGFLVGAAMAYKPCPELMSWVETKVWELTEDTVREIVLHAVQEGVPQQIMDRAECQARRMAQDDDYMNQLMTKQRLADSRHYGLSVN